MTVEKPKPKQLLRPITTGANSAMNQSQFLAITCNSFLAREKSRVHGAVCFASVSHWLKNWRESFKPITKHSNRNQVFTFDSQLKTALKHVIKMKTVLTVTYRKFTVTYRNPLLVLHCLLFLELLTLLQFTKTSYYNWNQPTNVR